MTQTGDASAMNAGAQGSGSQQGGAQGGAQGGVMDQAKDTAQQLAGQAKEQATQRAQGVFDQGKSRAAEQLTGVAQTLRQTTQQLQSGGQLAFAAPYLDRGVGQLERLAEYVRTADARDFGRQAEGFARRQPALFLGILFGAGLAGARFLKSSQRDATSSQGAGRGYPNYGGGSYAGGYGAGMGGSTGASYGGGSYGSGSTGGSVGGFYDDAGTSRSSGASGGLGSSGLTGGSAGGSLGGAVGGSTTDASDERGMDIGPTSSGLRGDI